MGRTQQGIEIVSREYFESALAGGNRSPRTGGEASRLKPANEMRLIPKNA